MARLPNRSPQEIAVPGITVAGHPATVTWTQCRRGFIKRWPVTYVTVEFYCGYTDRQLRLEFSGRVPDEAFQEIVTATRTVRCH